MPLVRETGRLRRAAVGLATALLVAGCVTPEEGGQRQAEARDDGVQLTGQVDGTRVAVSDGGPETRVADCDPGDGLDDDVCWTTRTIDGTTFTFVIENPAVLVVGETVPVRPDDCTGCDEVRDHVVIDLRTEDGQQRASAGRLVVSSAGPRYAAGLTVRFPSGDRLDGDFNVRPLAPGER